MHIIPYKYTAILPPVKILIIKWADKSIKLKAEGQKSSRLKAEG
jgi:hypothetical protein